MKCPACPSHLSEVKAYGMKLDVCTDSCGGVWFDSGELARVDELHEKVDSRVLRPMGNQKVAVDKSRLRDCPCCPNTKLVRHLEDERSDVEVDICPTCEGVFLDFGELSTLRKNNTEKHGRAEVIDSYIARYAKDPQNAPKGLKALCTLLFRG